MPDHEVYGPHIHLSRNQQDELRQALPEGVSLPVGGDLAGLPIYDPYVGHLPGDADGEAGVAFVPGALAMMKARREIEAMERLMRGAS
jgi:hypothetical protein